MYPSVLRGRLLRRAAAHATVLGAVDAEDRDRVAFPSGGVDDEVTIFGFGWPEATCRGGGADVGLGVPLPWVVGSEELGAQEDRVLE